MADPKRRTGPLVVGAGLVLVLAVGIALDRPKQAEAAAEEPPPAPDEGQALRELYFPKHPKEIAIPGLGTITANKVELKPGAGYVEAPVEEVYFWYLEAMQGEDRTSYGELNLNGLSWVAYAQKDEPMHPRTLGLVPQGNGTLVFSTTANAQPLSEEGELPPDLPHPDGAKNVFSIDSGGGQRTVRYDVPMKPGEARAHFDRALPAAGWESKGALPRAGENPEMVRFDRDGRSLMISIESGPESGTAAVTLVTLGAME